MLNLIELKSINFDNMNFQNFSPILTTVYIEMVAFIFTGLLYYSIVPSS